MTRRTLFVPSLAVLGCLTLLALAWLARPALFPREAEAPGAVGAAAPADVADEITVGPRNKHFSRKAATLKVGDKVTFVNDDTVAHNVLVTGPGDKTRNSGLQTPGERATLGFDAAGAYNVECAIHPEMRMTIEVK
jgi:cytochrome c peroxidase